MGQAPAGARARRAARRREPRAAPSRVACEARRARQGPGAGRPVGCARRDRAGALRTAGARRPLNTRAAAAPSRALVVTTVMLGTISTILSATIVNVAFPALIDEFHVGHDTLQWVAAGYLAAMTATMLTTAWLVQTFGERNAFVGMLGLFLAASLLAAASSSTDALIGARVLQGAAAGVLQPLSMIVLFRVFPVEERGRAMALYGFGIVLAPAIGPAIGGALLEAFGWRSIFLLTVPFCIAGIALGATTLPRPAGRTSTRFDW